MAEDGTQEERLAKRALWAERERERERESEHLAFVKKTDKKRGESALHGHQR